jgi:hypothetical protein
MIGKLMRHDYYAIHEDRVFPPEEWRKPNGYGVGQNKGFHGKAIPVRQSWYTFADGSLTQHSCPISSA